MVVFIHVLIALAGVAQASYTLLRPSHNKVTLSAGFIAATLLSGSYLVITTHSPLLSACMSGLAYVCVTGSCTALAQRKLNSINT